MARACMCMGARAGDLSLSSVLFRWSCMSAMCAHVCMGATCHGRAGRDARVAGKSNRVGGQRSEVRREAAGVRGMGVTCVTRALLTGRQRATLAAPCQPLSRLP